MAKGSKSGSNVRSGGFSPSKTAASGRSKSAERFIRSVGGNSEAPF